jgi:hypothetical protein
MDSILITPDNYLYVVPEGSDPEQIALSLGYTLSECAVFLQSDFEAACYNFPNAFTLSAGVVGFDLTSAKGFASSQEKLKYANLEVTATEGYSTNQLASQSSLAEIDRLPEIQLVLNEVNTLAVELSANLAAIAAATTIDEVNNIVNPPYGEISTSRTGNDFNDSAYITFNSVSLTEADTELFIPATSTVISYILPTQFNGFSEAFTTGNYLVQIRETSTGRVLADFICPEGAAQAVSY